MLRNRHGKLLRCGPKFLVQRALLNDLRVNFGREVKQGVGSEIIRPCIKSKHNPPAVFKVLSPVIEQECLSCAPGSIDVQNKRPNSPCDDLAHKPARKQSRQEISVSLAP